MKASVRLGAAVLLLALSALPAGRQASAQDEPAKGPPGLTLAKGWVWIGPSDWWEFTARKGRYTTIAFATLGPALSEEALVSKAEGLDAEVRVVGARTLSDVHIAILGPDQKLRYIHYFIREVGKRTGYLNLGEHAYKVETTGVNEKDWTNVLKSLKKAQAAALAPPAADEASA